MVILLLGHITTFAFCAPVILNHSIRAQTNSLIFFNGDDFGSDPKVFFSVNGGAYQQATVVNKGDNTVTARLTLSSGLYSAFVRNGTSDSPPVFLNRANPMHMDMDEAVPGQAVRVFGRNLFISATPVIKLANVNDTSNPPTYYPVTTGSSPNSLRVFATIPSSTPLGTYYVYVSNGHGSNFEVAKAKLPRPLKIRAAATDYWNLGVGWAHDLDFYNNVYNVKTDPRLALHAVGDGVANDQLAIQQAIEMAAAQDPITQKTGGVVYLPAGNYKVQSASSNCITLKNRVVLAGAGMSSTKIFFGYGTPPSGKHYGLNFNSPTHYAGVHNVAFTNVNQDGTWTDNMYTNNSDTAPSTHLFLSGVYFDGGKGEKLQFYPAYGVVKNCKFYGRNGIRSNRIGMRYSNNEFHWTHGTGLAMENTEDAVIENNQFILGEPPSGLPDFSIVRHSLSINFVTNTWIGDNAFSADYPAVYNNDSEHIISEGGGGDRPGEDFGKFSESSGNTLDIVRMDGTEMTGETHVQGSVICIVHGPGRGQWRPITARSGGNLTMDGSWQVPPTVGSRFATFKWSARNTTIWRNTFTGTWRAIWMYSAAITDTAFSSNTITDMDGILLRPDQRLDRGQFSVMYNVQVTDNTVTHSNGDFPAMIGAVSTQVLDDSTFGTSVLNMEFRKNKVIGNNSTATNAGVVPGEGFFAVLRNQKSMPDYNEEGIAAVLGTIFQWNEANNTKVGAFHVNTASFNTTLNGNTVTSSITSPAPIVVNDKKLTGANNFSTNTVIYP